MGHRQQMTDKERMNWDIMQYNANKAARRGSNYAYMSDEVYHDLQDKGYVEHIFDKGETMTISEYAAKKAVDELRANGHYARIICQANKLLIRHYSVYYKKKKK